VSEYSLNGSDQLEDMCKCENNIKMNVQEIERGGVDWINSGHDRDKWRDLVKAVMTLRVPFNAGNFLPG
jgi:hypothetical protein